MKHLNKFELHSVHGGANENSCDSFKEDLKKLLRDAEDNVGEGANSLADKINALIEKNRPK